MDHKKLNRQLTVGISLGLVFGFLVAFEIIPSVILGIPFVEIAKILGDVFVLLLKMVAVPLVFFSIFCGVASLGDILRVSRLGKKTLLYYIGTTSIACVIGLVLVNVIGPGRGITSEEAMVPSAVAAAKELHVLDMLMQQISTYILNPFDALASGTKAMIAVIFTSLLFGIGVLMSKHEKKQLIIDFMEACNDVAMELTFLVLKMAPYGVFGILVNVLYERRENLDELFASLGLFALTSFTALAIHGLIVMPLIIKYIAKRPVLPFFKGIAEPIKVAFGTDSSLATMPVTLTTMRDNFGVSKRTVNFVVPLGATINMDGTALYEAICALFIAQALGMDLNLYQQLIVFFTAMIASVGAAGIPSAGLVTLVVVLNAVKIPYELAAPFIGMIFTIDRFIDMCRTMVNVLGDCVGTIVVDKWMDEETQASEG